MSGGKRGRPGKSSYSQMMTFAPGAAVPGRSIYSQLNLNKKGGIEEEEDRIESDYGDDEFLKRQPKVIGQGARVTMKQNKK